jgi:hypothetical protein
VAWDIKVEGMEMKRALVLGIGIAGVAALLLVAVFALGSPTREAAQGGSRNGSAGSGGQDEKERHEGPRLLSEEEALREDARWYARDMGVSLEEAIRRLKMQDDRLPTELERELKSTEENSFAGLWLRHKPTYGLTVATAGDPEAMRQKIEPFIAGTSWEGAVNVKEVEATEAELNAARAAAEGMMDKLGIRYSSGDDIMKNRMLIFVRNKPRVERELRAADMELPAHVVLIEGVDMPT